MWAHQWSPNYLRFLYLGLLLCIVNLFPAHAQGTSNTPNGSVAQTVPPGTILPVVLRTNLSSDKAVVGQIVRGKISQDVPLPNHSKIPRGTLIEGQVVEARTAANGAPAELSLRFTKLKLRGESIPIVTNLRALAGFMEIEAAYTPEEPPTEGSPYVWLGRTQIGGDSVYGVGGPVMSAEDTSERVGTAVSDGVLVAARSKEGQKCRGPIAGNTQPQALWVFSSDACGVYGLTHVSVSHAGRTEPVGTFILRSTVRNVSLHSGDGFLLRIVA